MAFKHCEGCPEKKKKALSNCAKFRTCLSEKPSGKGKKGDKKPVKEGTYG